MRRLGMVILAILFLFMVFAGPAAPKSEAIVVSTVVIGAVIAAMAAAGIGLTVSGMTSAQLQEWVSGKLNDWATSLGGSVQDHIDSSHITTTGRGFLSLGTLAANGISQFISWLQIQDNLTDNSVITAVGGEAYLNGYKLGILPFYYANGSESRSADSTDTCYYYFNYRFNIGGGNVYRFVYLTNTNAVVTQYNDGTASPQTLIGPYNGWMYTDMNSGSTGIIDNWPNFDSSLIHNVNPTTIIGNGTGLSVTGSLDYETDVIQVPTISGTDKWFIDVGADPGVTVETATDGVIADTIDGTLTVSGEVAEEEPEIEINGPIGISGLTEVFPFCIPFDVYDLLSCLAADPQTPIFTVSFVIPGIINEEFTIDLTPFNAVAQIVRIMELIAFAIGLALVTRERFLRS